LERQTELEEEDNIINKRTQEDVNRLYSLLHDNIQEAAKNTLTERFIYNYERQ
jgi:hypothetical protein